MKGRVELDSLALLQTVEDCACQIVASTSQHRWEPCRLYNIVHILVWIDLVCKIVWIKLYSLISFQYDLLSMLWSSVRNDGHLNWPKQTYFHKVTKSLPSKKQEPISKLRERLDSGREKHQKLRHQKVYVSFHVVHSYMVNWKGNVRQAVCRSGSCCYGTGCSLLTQQRMLEDYLQTWILPGSKLRPFWLSDIPQSWSLVSSFLMLARGQYKLQWK